MAKGTSIVQYLNDFNTITNQLSSIEINLDDEIWELIHLGSLSNSLEAKIMVKSNSIKKSKLKFNDIQDLILV